MLASVEAVYRHGKIELAEVPTAIAQETPVIVTFLTSGYIDLPARGIDEHLATEIRTRLATFAEDWDAPEMDIYATLSSSKQLEVENERCQPVRPALRVDHTVEMPE